MSAILNLINFTKAFVVGPEGAGSTEEISEEQRQKVVSDDAASKARTSKLQEDLEDAQIDMEDRKTKYREDKTKQGPLGRALSEDTKFLMDTGSEAAAKQRAEGSQMPQGSLTQGSGVGTGKATGINRAKIAQKPLGTAGKVPSMSTKVRMNKPPKMAMPQVPNMQSAVSKLAKAANRNKDSGMFGSQRVVPPMTEREKRLQFQAWTESKAIAGQAKKQLSAEREKKFNMDRGYLEKEYDDKYKIKGRPQRNVQGQKDKGNMKVTGKGVQTLQQIIVDRANKLKGKE